MSSTQFDFGLGAEFSPEDPKDYQVASILGAPMELAIRYVAPGTGTVLNQGQTPQCVSYSTCGAKVHEDLNVHPGAVSAAYDENRFYGRLKQRDGMPGQDGTNFRTALDTAVKEGIPTTAGDHRKIASYYSVPVDYATIKQVVHQLGEVLIAIDWTESWFKPFANGVVPAPDHTAGGHAVRVIGWDDRRLNNAPGARNLIIRNSWGAGWGMKGSFYLPVAYLAQAREAWKFIDA